MHASSVKHYVLPLTSVENTEKHIKLYCTFIPERRMLREKIILYLTIGLYTNVRFAFPELK